MVATKQRESANPVESWSQLRSAWRAGTRSRHRPTPQGLPAGSASGDWHYANEHEFLRQMELVRHYERNDPVVNGALNRLQSNVVQNGYTLDPQTEDEETDARLKQDWLEWSQDPYRCDRSGQRTFDELAALAFRSAVRDGDAFLVPLKSGTIKLYEAHRCRTPSNTSRNVVHGILLDEHRQPLEYWFTREPIEPTAAFELVGDAHRVKAFDSLGRPQVFHVSRPTRESQARGVSWMAPSIDYIEMSSNIHFAKMVQQLVVSCYSLIIDRTSPSFRPEDAEADEAGRDKTRDEYLQSLMRPLEDIVPGTIYDPLPGEKLVGFSPNVPNPEFFEHATMLLTFLAINVDVPVAVLLLDPRQTNFSGWRGAIDQARVSWRAMQQWLVRRVHRPTYQWWVRRKLASEPWLQEKFAAGVDVYAHDWKPPAWAYIQPEEDARADQLIIQSGMESRKKRMAARGLSYDDEMPANFSELEWELKQCVDIATSVNEYMADKEAGKPFDVREVAIARGVIPNPNATSLSAPLGEKGKPADKEAVA